MSGHIRRFGELQLKVGDLVKMNPESMDCVRKDRGEGLALITGVVREWERPWGRFLVKYVDNLDSLRDDIIMADDMTDILDVVNRA